MRIRLQDGLPYITASITYGGQSLQLENVLLDTGSVGTIFSTDRLLTMGLRYEPDDFVHRIRGIGGSEFVFTKRIDQLTVGDLQISDFEIEVGAMEYGFEIDGIIGMDCLTQVRAVIDLGQLEIQSTQ